MKPIADMTRDEFRAFQRDFNKALGRRIREERLRRGWTQAQLAAAADCSAASISELESGRRETGLADWWRSAGRLASARAPCCRRRDHSGGAAHRRLRFRARCRVADPWLTSRARRAPQQPVGSRPVRVGRSATTGRWPR